MAIRGTQSVQQGWNQSTAASQAIMSGGLGVPRSSPKPRRGTRRASVPRPPRREPTTRPQRKRATGKLQRLVKGSAAAKRHMAKLRRMVGRRRR